MLGLAGWIRDGKATRRRIAELVAYSPGIHVSEISERLGLAWSTVEYHVRQMAKKGLIDLQKRSRELCAFPQGLPARERAWMIATRDDDARRILSAIMERPRLGITSLSEGLNLSKKVIRHHLDILVGNGILHRHGEFRPRFQAEPGTEDWLQRQLESPLDQLESPLKTLPRQAPADFLE